MLRTYTRTIIAAVMLAVAGYAGFDLYTSFTSVSSQLTQALSVQPR